MPQVFHVIGIVGHLHGMRFCSSCLTVAVLQAAVLACAILDGPGVICQILTGVLFPVSPRRWFVNTVHVFAAALHTAASWYVVPT